MSLLHGSSDCLSGVLYITRFVKIELRYLTKSHHLGQVFEIGIILSRNKDAAGTLANLIALSVFLNLALLSVVRLLRDTALEQLLPEPFPLQP